MSNRDWEPQKVRRMDVIKAAKIWDANGYKNFKKSIFYDVIIGGKPYPPKAISSCAHELATGRSLTTTEFGGARHGIWHERLKELGFFVIEKRPQIDFQTQVALALKMSASKRAKLLVEVPATPPERIATQVYRFVRNPLVAAERLVIANGICEECHEKAPFNRKKDGSPYLEVHHIEPLSKGGFDLVENTKAVCPNCHCKIHDSLDLDLSND